MFNHVAMALHCFRDALGCGRVDTLADRDVAVGGFAFVVCERTRTLSDEVVRRALCVLTSLRRRHHVLDIFEWDLRGL